MAAQIFTADYLTRSSWLAGSPLSSQTEQSNRALGVQVQRLAGGSFLFPGSGLPNGRMGQIESWKLQCRSFYFYRIAFARGRETRQQLAASLRTASQIASEMNFLYYI